MKLETTIDRFGRVLIPKSVRDSLALQAGSVVTLEERCDGIFLRLRDEKPTFEVREGVLVYNGEVLDDGADSVRRVRDERIDSFLPSDGKRPRGSGSGGSQSGGSRSR